MGADRPPDADVDLELTDLAAVLAAMGGVLLSVETAETAMELVTRLATAALPVSSGAGVTLVDDTGKRSTAASDPLVEQADALQYEHDDGPCLTAAREAVLVRIDDVATERRWSDWCAAVAPLGVVSVLSSPLMVGDQAIGAIKVYARRAHAFDAGADRLLMLFSDQAAILLANTLTIEESRRKTAQFTEVLHHRDLVGQAKGILLTRGARDDAEAFAMLVAASRRSRLKVHDVARRLVASVVAEQPPDPRATDPNPST